MNNTSPNLKEKLLDPVATMNFDSCIVCDALIGVQIEARKEMDSMKAGKRYVKCKRCEAIHISYKGFIYLYDPLGGALPND